MLSKNNFAPEHIRMLQSDFRLDPSLLERTVFAFGLLEALALVGLDFIFKGGTCLMLLLEQPMRLSTDIDIITAPGTEMDTYIEKAAEVFPFLSRKEQVRNTARNIEKRHFKFFYTSPLTNREQHIILDIVFENNYYLTTVKREIANSFLVTEAPATFVTTPTTDCILGDKLTAFAPHTIGIPFGADKELEVIKQHYDIAVLMNKLNNFADVKDTYKQIAEMEIEYRGLKNISYRETLIDSFNSAMAIIGRGKLFSDDYKYLSAGIRRIKGHILGGYSHLAAESQSCHTVYLIASVLTDKEDFTKLSETSSYIERTITHPLYSKLNHVKRANLNDFAYLYEAIKMFEEI